MAIDWDRAIEVATGESLTVITISDEETVDVSAGKEILYIRNVEGEGGSGDVNWGDIGGTLQMQNDLWTALGAKANTADLGALAAKNTADYATDVTNKPTLGTMASVNDASSDDKTYGRKNGTWVEVTGGGGGGGTWGSITGTLSDQTDLQNALDTKSDITLLAEEFDSSKTYYAENWCTKDGKLYQFRAQHTGAWDPLYVDERVAVEYLWYKYGQCAPIGSPTFLGTPKAPTPTAGDSSTQIATTAFVQGEISGKADTADLGDLAYEDDAASDNKTYGRKNGAWVEVTGGGGGSTDWDDITNKPSTFPPSSHTHDDRYYTESETDALLADKADTADLGDLAGKDTVDWDTDIDDIPSTFPPSAHTHDDRYYTESETDALLTDKQDELTFDSTPTSGSTNPATSGGIYTAIHGRALHISMASTSSLGTISNAGITTTMRVINVVWSDPDKVTSDVSWNTNTAGQLVLSGTLSGATSAEIDLIDFG